LGLDCSWPHAARATAATAAKSSDLFIFISPDRVVVWSVRLARWRAEYISSRTYRPSVVGESAG
jgi:hypothetical protein